MDPKPLTIGWPSPQPPAPRGVWGPRLADSRDPGPSGPVRGATLPIFLENRPKHRFLALLEVWGVPPRGVWGPRLAESRDPGPPVPVRGADPANFWLLEVSDKGDPVNESGQNKHFWQFWWSGGTPKGVWGPSLADSRDPKPSGPVRGGDPAKFPAPAPSGQVRGQPALSPALKPEKSFFAGFRATLTGCERRSVCWEPLLLVERPAQAARTHNPTIIHFSSVFAVTRTFCAECEGKQRARKPPLEGGWGGEP